MVHYDIHIGPALELALPIRNSRQGSYDQERSANPIFIDCIHKRQRLNCFSQTHLIGENAIVPVVP